MYLASNTPKCITKQLPFLTSTDHWMPMTRHCLTGSGWLFTQTIRAGQQDGGIWLVMQDSRGYPAMADGDVMTLAVIESVDWLSQQQIQVHIATLSFGRIMRSSDAPAQPTRLTGQLYGGWSPSSVSLAADDVLITRLHQWQAEFGLVWPEWVTNQTPLCANWVCLRWLELLPLSLKTKQRLLKQPSARNCLRYLKKVIRQSDRYH